MRKIEFKKKKESILNTMFLKLEYMSGDADAWEYQEHQLDGISFSNYTEHLEEIEKIGWNPKENKETKTKRNKIKVDLELPMKEEYSNFIEKLVKKYTNE